MEKQHPSPREQASNRILYLVSLNHMVNDGSVYLLSSLFPIVVSLFALSAVQVGMIVGVGYLTSVIFQAVIGRYSENRSSRNLLAIGMAIICVSVVSFVFATGFFTLLGSVVVLRLGSSFFHPVGVSAVSRSYEGSRQEKALGFQSAFGNLGILIVFLASVPVYTIIGWRATFIGFAIVLAFDIVVTLALFKNPPPASRRDIPRGRSNRSSDHKDLIGIPFFFVATMIISGGSYAVALNFANLLFQGQIHLTAFLSNVLVSVWVISAFVGAISTGRWAGGVQRGTHLTLAYLFAALSIIAFTYVSGNLPFLFLTLIANGFMISATYPLVYSELSKHLENEPERKGRSFGIIFSAQTIGSSLVGFASGYISQMLGLPIAFVSVGILTFMGSVLAFIWSRREGKDSALHASLISSSSAT